MINAIWIYNLTVASGHFDVLRRSFEKVSPDQRIQAIIIAFCFGALLEALAGFGTPVAISVVMLMSLGFKPVKAATVALVANTAPVAFGALAIPIVTLAPIASGVSNDPRLSDANALDTLGVDGRPADPDPGADRAAHPGAHRRRPPRRAPDLAAGAALRRGVFAVAQFVTANYISVQLTDIVASLLAAGSLVLLRAGLAAGRGADRRAAAERRRREPAPAASAAASAPAVGDRDRSVTGGDRRAGDRLGSGPAAARATAGPTCVRAYAPYLVIIVIFSITNIPAVVDFLAKEPWTYLVRLAGPDIINAAGDPVRRPQFKLNWLPAAGTLLIIAGLITMVILKVSARPRRSRPTCATYVELRSAIITVMAVLALAYVMNLSGQTASLGAWLAGAGGAFAILSPILGWIGVAVTGSDTSVELAVRRPAGAGGDQGRARPGADGGRELLGRRARQDGQPAEPRHRGGRRRHGRAGRATSSAR